MHGIASKVISRAQAAALAFFARSSEYKAQYDISRAARHSGYVPFTEKGLYQDEAQRMYEAYDIGLELSSSDSDYLAGNIFYGPNTWPDLIGFRATVYAYYEAVRELSQLLTQTIEAALGPRAAQPATDDAKTHRANAFNPLSREPSGAARCRIACEYGRAHRLRIFHAAISNQTRLANDDNGRRMGRCAAAAEYLGDECRRYGRSDFGRALSFQPAPRFEYRRAALFDAVFLLHLIMMR